MDEQAESSKRSLRPPFINRLYPAETRLKEGAIAHDSTKQVGVFPCRGLVAPCQRAPGSISGPPFRCQPTLEQGFERR